MDVRERMRRYIENSDKLSYASVAKEAGLSNSAVHKYCTGQVRSMTIENIEKIARAMGVSFRWLVFGDGHPDIEHIWDRIPSRRKEQALKVLETFADPDNINGTDG